MKNRIAKRCRNPATPYTQKYIDYATSLLLLLLIPASYIHLKWVSKNSNFYVNIVKSDLTESVAMAVGETYKNNRYNKLLGKFYLLPLRAYSHLVRGEWIFESSTIKNVLSTLAESYILFFIKKMRSKRFFIREDFFGEASLLCSISQMIGCFTTISYQHGSMNLKEIKCEGIYPGQRANMQISHDIASYAVCNTLNEFGSKIILSKPCYRCVSEMPVEHSEIFMIGNSSLAAYRELVSIAACIRNNFEHIKIYFKPHPSEKIIKYENMKRCRSIDGSLLMEPSKKIFIGETSTFLYDAYMSGHLVYFLDQNKFPCFDSIAMLGWISEITALNACKVVSSIIDNNLVKSGFTVSQDALDYKSVAKMILDLAPV